MAHRFSNRKEVRDQMTLLGIEHHELMGNFEKLFKHRRLEKEPKDLWTKGAIYQDGEVNQLFLAYRQGYALGKAVQ